MRMSVFMALVSMCLLFPSRVLANNARDYIPLEPGSTFFALYYNHIFGDEIFRNEKKIADNANFTGNISLIRPVYYVEIGPFTVDPQFILPFGEVELGDTQSSGLGDLIFGGTIWFINNKESKFLFAWTPFVIAPTGEYDSEKAVNMGSNRWATKQELCVVKGFGEKTWLEVAASVEIYGDNDDVTGLDGRITDMSQDPGIGSEVHLSYDFYKGFFGALDYYYHYDGETTISDVDNEDSGSRHTIGGTLAYMVTPNMQLMTEFRSDVSVDSGVKTNTIGARLGFVF